MQSTISFSFSAVIKINLQHAKFMIQKNEDTTNLYSDNKTSILRIATNEIR